VVDYAEGGVTVAFVISDDADGEQVIHLFEAALLANDLAVQRIQALYAGFEFGGNAVFNQLGANGSLDFFQKPLMDRLLFGDFFLQAEKRFRLQHAKGKIFQFIANYAHTKAVSNRRVDLKSFASDALLLGRLQEFDGAHVVQAISELDHHDADVVDHGQDHLAHIFGLARFRSGHAKPADFSDAFNQTGGFFTKAFLNA
jgi:hypothetical protein